MVYVTRATTSGGRNGRAILEGGALALAMAAPKEIGGNGEGHNPEQLFALGYSACFCQAVLSICKKHGVNGDLAKVVCEVTLNIEGGATLAVELRVSIPGTEREKLEELVNEAHSICPYSKATRGNIPLKLVVL